MKTTRSGVEMDGAVLKALCKKHGADDAGIVELDRPALAPHVKDILHAFGGTLTLVCLAKRIHAESVRSPAKHIKDAQFAYVGKELASMTHGILTELFAHGVKGVAEIGVFPLSAERWPGKIWTLPLKVLAVEAGLGHMGANRLVLHPDFGAFVYYSGLLLDVVVNGRDSPLPAERAPCLRCNLCVTACPTGALKNADSFGFVSCLTHNYRERLGGFIDWSERVAAGRNARGYRNAVTDREAVSMWQSLFCGAGTQCDYCMAACPAGTSYSGEYAADKREYFKRVVRPLMEQETEVFVVPGSDADFHLKRHASKKLVRHVSNGVRPASASDFLNALPVVFQREPAAGLSARYHFTFTGREAIKATVCIENQSIQVFDGHSGRADCSVIADGDTWINTLAGRKSLLIALLARKIRVSGSLLRLRDFKRCFPDGA
jgi:ferredoxin